MPGIDQKQDKSSDRPADDRPEARDQVRDAADNSDQSDVIHPGDRHEDRCGSAHDHRVKDREHDVADKYVVALAQKMHRLPEHFGRHQGLEQPGGPLSKRFLRAQKIEREYKSQSPAHNIFTEVLRCAYDALERGAQADID